MKLIVFVDFKVVYNETSSTSDRVKRTDVYTVTCSAFCTNTNKKRKRLTISFCCGNRRSTDRLFLSLQLLLMSEMLVAVYKLIKEFSLDLLSLESVLNNLCCELELYK